MAVIDYYCLKVTTPLPPSLHFFHSFQNRAMKLSILVILEKKLISTKKYFGTGLPVLRDCQFYRVARSFFKMYLLLQFLSYRAQIFMECSLTYCLQIAISLFWNFACNHFYGSICTHMFKNWKILNIFHFWTSIKMVTGKISKKWYSNLKTIYQRVFHKNLSPVAQKL